MFAFHFRKYYCYQTCDLCTPAFQFKAKQIFLVASWSEMNVASNFVRTEYARWTFDRLLLSTMNNTIYLKCFVHQAVQSCTVFISRSAVYLENRKIHWLHIEHLHNQIPTIFFLFPLLLRNCIAFSSFVSLCSFVFSQLTGYAHIRFYNILYADRFKRQRYTNLFFCFLLEIPLIIIFSFFRCFVVYLLRAS